MNRTNKKIVFEDDISSTQSSEGEDYIPKRIISKSNTRRIHKIPIELQQQLFRQVFQEGKQIKEVAKALNLNYSSAKSLIHYYKNNKRSAPSAVLEVLSGKKVLVCRVSQKIDKKYNNLKIEVRQNNQILHSYNYYEPLTTIK
ncbi:unnamed protein product (macronuclear) [Paramecium tetraurelia]|uniref:Chromosome undetermined scaffold_1, whole genome shotgun sequence n=1 Tax=Paramecium tetraurelia TaxID=5888 RepID=Q6BFP3_PARTE|nr:hypothetical protein [Paramecium tetraurelia strain d4-2]XP_001423130.1 uncharacterized protein GSPATT00000167001 [Paramecium tetraurelia]CAH03527.1 hypothetical protein PTMB.329c [Paramecium tetraurelia]CAK55732.1 unnamed protein product [Paramecium tetraurelia]|eukprot:XP_001423130.1 hypothetical protein (macronuclear) [Paramecium tetraurelia strain d4-2]